MFPLGLILPLDEQVFFHGLSPYFPLNEVIIRSLTVKGLGHCLGRLLPSLYNACMNGCMDACLYVSMHVCTSIYIYIIFII